MKRYHLIVKGRVQGVGFRFFCQYTALQTDLTGYAKNLYNGDVEVEIQGEQEGIDSFLAKIKDGNRFIRVNEVQMDEMAIIQDERGFTSK